MPHYTPPSADQPESVVDHIIKLIRMGERAHPANFITRGEAGNERTYAIPGMSTTAGLEGALPIGATIPSLISEDGYLDIDPPYQDAGTEVRLDAALAKSSRALGMGAHLIETPYEFIEVGSGPNKLLATRQIQFGTFEAATFSIVDLDADPAAEVPLTDPPLHNAELDRNAMTSRALAFKLSRRQLKDKTNERLAFELAWSIAQGLGRAVDATMFD
jgi:hypothetical protein